MRDFAVLEPLREPLDFDIEHLLETVSCSVAQSGCKLAIFLPQFSEFLDHWCMLASHSYHQYFNSSTFFGF